MILLQFIIETLVEKNITASTFIEKYSNANAPVFDSTEEVKENVKRVA